MPAQNTHVLPAEHINTGENENMCVFCALLQNNIKTVNSLKYCKVIWDVTMLMSLESSKHSNHNQFYASLSPADGHVQVYYMYYCQSKAAEQKSVPTPNVFKQY